MNAVEHIIECYFRYCKRCFTITDVKIVSGNNRQADLFAYNLKTKDQYHVESSVTHCKNWSFFEEDLEENFGKKFLGLPPKRKGRGTDRTKGKNYYNNIIQTYKSVGFSPARVQRVFIQWAENDKIDLNSFLKDYYKRNRMRVFVWSLRDKILPELKKEISTSNYEDEVLRTLSLLRQFELQTRNRERQNFKRK